MEHVEPSRERGRLRPLTPPVTPGDMRRYAWRVGVAGLGIVALIIGVILGPREFPTSIGDSVGGGMDDAVDWLTIHGAFLFDNIKEYITRAIVELRDFLLEVPWPVTIGVVGLLAWRLAGWKVALFTAGSLLMIGFVGLWESAMVTVALMVISVALSVAIAVPVGVLAARSNVVDALIRPILDIMQTMPSFVYLVPAIFFFSLGNVPAVIATVIYAVPPAIRLTNLGIRQVSPEVIESARAFGSTNWQLLFKVQIPLAMPTIMAGITQTVMMALAMVVIASLVGAGGLGRDVMVALGRLEVGDSVLAGSSIVILAIIIDRMTQGFARSRQIPTRR